MMSIPKFEDNSEAIIFNIDRYATHDGPGIRTNIYFKGCPLRCIWCSNPEGQSKLRELAFNEAKCNGCKLCIDACPRYAIRLENDQIVIDRDKCDLCEQCLPVCPTNALFTYGESYTLSRIMDIIERDRHIYRTSGGGITCTGGEAFQQPGFLLRFLSKCHDDGIQTAVETCGYVEEAVFRTALDRIDWLLFDLKHLDSALHKKLTGKYNAIILNNLRIAASVLGKRRKVLAIRQVVIPGLNDTDNITAVVELAKTLPHLDLIELLPYHAYGKHKYQYLRRKYQLEDTEPPQEKVLSEYQSLIESQDIKCCIGGL